MIAVTCASEDDIADKEMEREVHYCCCLLSGQPGMDCDYPGDDDDEDEDEDDKRWDDDVADGSESDDHRQPYAIADFVVVVVLPFE